MYVIHIAHTNSKHQSTNAVCLCVEGGIEDEAMNTKRILSSQNPKRSIIFKMSLLYNQSIHNSKTLKWAWSHRSLGTKLFHHRQDHQHVPTRTHPLPSDVS